MRGRAGNRALAGFVAVLALFLVVASIEAWRAGRSGTRASEPSTTATRLPRASPGTRAPLVPTPTGPTYLADLKPRSADVGWGTFSVGRYTFTSESPEDRIHKGDRMVAHGTWYRHGLYAHAPSILVYELDGRHLEFSSTLVMVNLAGWRVNDLQTAKRYDVNGAVFAVSLDGAEVFRSRPMWPFSQPRHITLNVYGKKLLVLMTDPRGNKRGNNGCDWTIWGDPILR